MLLYVPGTAQIRTNAHSVDRARGPFDLDLFAAAKTIPGVSSGLQACSRACIHPGEKSTCLESGKWSVTAFGGQVGPVLEKQLVGAYNPQMIHSNLMQP